MRNRTDYATYPGDRHTRQTPAQLARKREAALIHMQTALRDLRAICDDYAANGYRLTLEERRAWQEAARAHDALNGAIRELS